MFLLSRIPAFLLAFALFFQAAAGPPQGPKTENTPSHHPLGTRLTVDGIANFGQVSDDLYRGGVPSLDALETLKKMGVNIVIDMRRGSDPSEESRVTKLGMQYVSIPSRCPFPQDEPIAKFLQVVEENPGKKIFVHCRLGDDRTGLAVASYRIAEQGWSADEAVNEMKVFGFSGIHNVICPGLESYATKLPEHLKTDPAFRTLSPGIERESK